VTIYMSVLLGDGAIIFFTF